MKTLKQKPTGFLQPLSVPEWKWENVSIDFILELPRSLKGYKVIWFIVDKLTKSAHFTLLEKQALLTFLNCQEKAFLTVLKPSLKPASRKAKFLTVD